MTRMLTDFESASSVKSVDHFAPEEFSAAAILGFLEAHFPVNAAIARTIRELCG